MEGIVTNRVRRLAGLVALGVFASTAVVLAGCGGGGGKDEKIDTSGVVVDQNTTAQAAAEQIIEVKDGSFSPDTVTIKAGTKVIWKWTANVSCSLLMSGSAAPEQSSGTYERLFSSGGSTYSYQCEGKPAMAGKITVE